MICWVYCKCIDLSGEYDPNDNQFWQYLYFDCCECRHFRCCFREANQSEDIKDIRSESFRRVFEKRFFYKEKRKVICDFLHTVSSIRWETLQAKKQIKSREVEIAALLTEFERSVQAFQIQLHSLRLAIDKMFMGLSEKDKTIMTMHFLESKQVAEIAVLFNDSSKNIELQIKKILKRIRKEIVIAFSLYKFSRKDKQHIQPKLKKPYYVQTY